MALSDRCPQLPIACRYWHKEELGVMPACCTYAAAARLQPCTLQAADELAILVHVHLATVTRVDLALGELL